MEIITIYKEWTYYVGEDDGKKWYNIVPSNQPAPSGGYYQANSICALKNLPNLFHLDQRPQKAILFSLFQSF